MLIHDVVSLERLNALAPRHGVLDLKNPRSISGHIALPAPIVTNTSNWFSHERKKFEQQ